ncbi:hypothetical protein HAX54_008648, partial [Datura stramonium]|nr:hypothetical protein [Datura stramonium]
EGRSGLGDFPEVCDGEVGFRGVWVMLLFAGVNGGFRRGEEKRERSSFGGIRREMRKEEDMAFSGRRVRPEEGKDEERGEEGKGRVGWVLCCCCSPVLMVVSDEGKKREGVDWWRADGAEK